MFKHIPVAVGGSHHFDRAIKLAMRAAEGSPGARLSAVLVVPDCGLADDAQATFVAAPDAAPLREVLAARGRGRAWHRGRRAARQPDAAWLSPAAPVLVAP